MLQLLYPCHRVHVQNIRSPRMTSPQLAGQFPGITLKSFQFPGLTLPGIVVLPIDKIFSDGHQSQPSCTCSLGFLFHL